MSSCVLVKVVRSRRCFLGVAAKPETGVILLAATQGGSCHLASRDWEALASFYDLIHPAQILQQSLVYFNFSQRRSRNLHSIHVNVVCTVKMIYLPWRAAKSYLFQNKYGEEESQQREREKLSQNNLVSGGIKTK